MGKRKCSHCKQTKNIDKFRMRSDGKYFHSWCKACEKVYYRTSEANRFSRAAHNLNRKYKGKITASELRKLGAPDICYLCGEKINIGDAEYDHVLPRKEGGILSFENIKWTHRCCNRIKHDLPLPKLINHLRKMIHQLEKLGY